MTEHDFKICFTILKSTFGFQGYSFRLGSIVNHQSFKQLKNELNVRQLGGDIPRNVDKLESLGLVEVTERNIKGIPLWFKLTKKGSSTRESEELFRDLVDKPSKTIQAPIKNPNTSGSQSTNSPTADRQEKIIRNGIIAMVLTVILTIIGWYLRYKGII